MGNMADYDPNANPLAGAVPVPDLGHERDEHGHLTRKGMEQALAAGQAVSHGGRILHRVEDLPSEEELADREDAREAKALEMLMEQAKRLDGEIAKLAARRKNREKQSSVIVHPIVQTAAEPETTANPAPAPSPSPSPTRPSPVPGRPVGPQPRR